MLRFLKFLHVLEILMRMNKNKIHRQILKIVLTVLSLIVVFATLLLIFENHQRDSQNARRRELCASLADFPDHEVLEHLRHNSKFEQSISQHKSLVHEEAFSFDAGDCLAQFDKVL